MYRKDLIKEIALRQTIPISTAESFWETIEDIIYDTLMSGEFIQIKDFFRFEIGLFKGGTRHNLLVDKMVYVPPKYKIKMKPIGTLKRDVERQEVSILDKKKAKVPTEYM